MPRAKRVREALVVGPVLPVRAWFDRWFRSLSDHVTEVGADTQHQLRSARDDVVHEVRAGDDSIAARVQRHLDVLGADVRAEAGGVAEVALATERRLARLEASIATLLSTGDAASTSVVDGPWVHRAVAPRDAATIVLTGPDARLGQELRAAGHVVVHAAADGVADVVVLRDPPGDDVEGVLDAARRTLAPGGAVVLAAGQEPPAKALDAWDVADHRVVTRTDAGWSPSGSDADRWLYILT